MKIVLDCERMKHPYTGLFEYCYQLGIALRQRVVDKDDLIYYVPQSVQYMFGSNNNFIEQRSIDKIFYRNFNADILHTTYQLSRYMGGNKNVKRLLTIHDLNFLYEKKAPSKVAKYLKKMQDNINRSDHIIAISNYVKQDVLDHLEIGNKPFDVIYNGCNVLEFDTYDTPIYKPKKDFLFSIGTVLPKKNFHVLPRILVGNDYELIIAGRSDENYQNKIIKEAKQFNVEDRVKLIGSVSYEDKYWYLKNCLAFMFPSIAEGFGIPVIEAMHFGKPTFLSTHTSLPEVGGKFAYYFQNFEPEYMQQLFRDSLEDYSQNDRIKDIKEHASYFRWDRCADEYYKIYQKLYESK